MTWQEMFFATIGFLLGCAAGQLIVRQITLKLITAQREYITLLIERMKP